MFAPAPHSVPSRRLVNLPPIALLYAARRRAWGNYPLNIRPVDAEPFFFWDFHEMQPGGESVLLTFSVPQGRIAVINRFGAAGTDRTSFTITIDGVFDPVVKHVGYFLDFDHLWHYDSFWRLQTHWIPAISGRMLIDPILADGGSEVGIRCYSWSLLPEVEFGGGVSGFFCKRPPGWSMG